MKKSILESGIRKDSNRIVTLIDCDGVLADFTGMLQSVLKDKFGIGTGSNPSGIFLIIQRYEISRKRCGSTYFLHLG